jgi:ribonuclease Z
MAKITFLGTASAVPDRNHQNTHFVVQTESGTVLVDCVGNPIVRLREAGIDPLSITDLVLTHFHPDHVSGVPLLLMDLWLLGRKQPLDIYGLESVLAPGYSPRSIGYH